MAKGLETRMTELERRLGTDRERPVLVWRDLGVTADEVERRFLEEHPEHLGRKIIVLGWMDTAGEQMGAT